MTDLNWRSEFLLVAVFNIAVILLSLWEIPQLGWTSSSPIVTIPLFLSVPIGISLVLPLVFNKLTSVQTFALVMIPLALVAVIPALLGASPLQPHTFQYFSDPIQVKNSGHINPAIFPFENWPGYAIIGGSLLLVCGPQIATLLILLFPVFVDLIILFMIAGVTKYYKSTDRNYVRFWCILSIIFILVNFTEIGAFLPQGIAFTLFLCLMWFAIQRQTPFTRSDSLLVLILVFGTIISHLFTSIVVIVFLTLLAIRLPLIQRNGSRVLRITHLGSVIALFTIWNAFFAVETLRLGTILIPQFFETSILNSFLYYLGSYGGKAVGPIYQSVASLRIDLVALIATLAMVGFGAWISSEKREESGEIFLKSFLSALIGVLTVVSGVTAGYLIRIYAISILPLGYFASYLAKNRKLLTLILALIITLVPLHFYTIYGMQSWDHLDNSYLTGLSYFDSKTVTGTVVEIQYPYYGDPLPFGYFNEPNTYSVISHQPADPSVLSRLASTPSLSPVYFITTPLAVAVYSYVAGSNQPLQNTTVWLNDHFDRTLDIGSVIIWSSH